MSGDDNDHSRAHQAAMREVEVPYQVVLRGEDAETLIRYIGLGRRAATLRLLSHPRDHHERRYRRGHNELVWFLLTGTEPPIRTYYDWDKRHNLGDVIQQELCPGCAEEYWTPIDDDGPQFEYCVPCWLKERASDRAPDPSDNPAFHLETFR